MKVTGLALRVTLAGVVIGGCALAGVLLVAGTSESAGGCPQGSTDAATTTSMGSLPAFSCQLIDAVNATDMTIAVVSPQVAASATVSESAAVSKAVANMPPDSTAVAAQLVEVTDTQYPQGGLVWAVDVVPVLGASSGPMGHTGPPPPRNFTVQLVDAHTGIWVEGVSGYSADLGSGTA